MLSSAAQPTRTVPSPRGSPPLGEKGPRGRTFTPPTGLRTSGPGRKRLNTAPSFSLTHFKSHVATNVLLVPTCWVAVLVALVKSFYVGSLFGVALAIGFAFANTILALYKFQDRVRSMILYVTAIIVLIKDSTPDNVVSFCFLIVALAFLVKDKAITTTNPLLGTLLVSGYLVTLVSVAVVGGNVVDLSVLLPEVGGLLLVVVLVKDRILPPPFSRPDFQLTTKLTESEAWYVLRIIAGRSYKEVAFENSVSPSTVRNMISRSLRKLQLQNVHELVRFASKFNLVL